MSYAAPSYDRKIDIGASVRAAYGVVIENARLAVELAWLPFAILVVAEVIALVLGGGGLFGRAFAGLVRAGGFLIFGTVFVVRWHRFLLLGENMSAGLFPPGWGGFVLAGIKVGLTVFVAALILGLIAAVPPHFLTALIAAIGYVALAFASARVSLVFPAAAIEQPISLREAWDLIAGNYWRLFACVLLCVVPFGIVHAILGSIGFGLPWVLWFVFEVIGLAVTFAAMAVAASVLSDIYRGLAPAAPVQRVA
jgi:hypothetical protein